MSWRIARTILFTSLGLSVFTLISQWCYVLWGTPHICTTQYIASTIGFIIVTITSLVVARKYPVAAISLWAWGAILSVSVSGLAYAILDDSDDYPTMLYMFYLIILCAGTVMGFWRTLPSVVVSCLIMTYAGWLRGREDQATVAIITVACLFLVASWFNHLFRENADLKRYVDIEIDGAKAKLRQRRDTDLGKEA